MVKLVHFAVVNGTPIDIERLGKHLQKVVDDTKHEYEFLITNDRIVPRDPRDLLEEYKTLISSFEELVKKYKEVEENEKNKN